MASVHAVGSGAGRRWIVRWREHGSQRGRSFTRRGDARAFQADLIRRRQLGELYEDDGGTVGGFLDGWLSRYSLRVRPSTHARRAAAFRALHALRERPLARLTAADVEDEVTTLAHHAPRQAQIALASLKLALKDAAKRGLKFDRRILELDQPKATPRSARFLTWQQVQDLAQWLPDRHARLVMVAALSGLRRGEIMALTWGDVDLENGTLTVRAGKTEAARRTVDLPATAVALLREQYDWRRNGDRPAEGRAAPGSFRPADGDGRRDPGADGRDADAGVGRAQPRDGRPRPDDLGGVGAGDTEPPPLDSPVFPNNRGGHLNARNWYNRWFLPVVKTLAEGETGRPHPAGGPQIRQVSGASPSASVYAGVTFHSLRHGFISMMAAAGNHPSVIAAQVGHSDGGALLLRRYRHLFPDEGKVAAAKFDAYLKESDAASRMD